MEEKWKEKKGRIKVMLKEVEKRGAVKEVIESGGGTRNVELERKK